MKHDAHTILTGCQAGVSPVFDVPEGVTVRDDLIDPVPGERRVGIPAAQSPAAVTYRLGD
jgi:hypothetical protein